MKKSSTWSVIAEQMKEDSFEPTNVQCESRWKYLLKKFKDFIANKAKTGAARKEFEFSNEMAEVLDKRPDIFPPILVGTNVKMPLVEPSLQDAEKRPADSGQSPDGLKATKRARTVQSPTQGTMLSLLDLPPEILIKICSLSGKSIAVVCPRFRELYCSLIKRLKLNPGALSDSTGLKYMTNLFQLTIDLTYSSFSCLVESIDQSHFVNLKYVHIHNLVEGQQIIRLAESLKRFELRGLELPQAKLSFEQLKSVFFTLPTLRYYCVTMEYYEVQKNLKEVAAFINDRIRTHNFSLDLLSMIPLELLPYPMHMYRKF